MAEAERKYKDTLFRRIFKEKKELLELYNALNGTDYTEPEELEVNTLENAVYMNRKNDISFIFASEVSLYEHQSTYSPNLPLRNLFYIARLYEKILDGRTLYSTAQVKIPAPRFVVFYNGLTDQPERKVLRLSEAYILSRQRPGLELEVIMLNINIGQNRGVMKKCRPLWEYAVYVDKVRTYAKEMELSGAVERAVNECIERNILREVLIKCKAEVIQMSIFEYDEEKEMQKIRKAEYEVGREEGRREGQEEGHREGREEGVRALIGILKGLDMGENTIMEKLEKGFGLSSEEALRYLGKY